MQDISQATPESVWAALRELAARQAENERMLTEKFAETDRLRQENERMLTEKFAETDRQRQENERMLTEKFAETDRLQKETDRQMKRSREDYDRRMINFEKTMGSWSNNHGSFAEEYFFNSFENGKQNFFGEKFDDIDKKVPGIKKGFRDEYDIVFTNGKSVCIIEVKFKAHQDHIARVLNKAATFRENFPYYANHRVYLGYASLAFDDHVEQDCIANGIAVIKQVGDTVVINDKHLKVF